VTSARDALADKAFVSIALGHYRQAMELLADTEAERRPLRNLAEAGIGRLRDTPGQPMGISTR
jgi:hypothetical protein